MCHQAGGDDVVVGGQVELRFLVDDEFQEVEHVAGVERRAVGWHGGGQVGLANEGHAVHLHGLAGLGERAVAAHTAWATASRNVHNHRARLHAVHHGLGDQSGRGAAGNEGGADDDVGRGHALGHFHRLARQPARRHGLGVTAHALGGFLFFRRVVAHFNELAAEGLDLLFHRGAHVRRLNDSAQALGGGNGLQPCHAHAQDHNARSLDGACRRHHHRHQLRVVGGRQQHRLVAGNVGLAGQHIQALRARGAWRGLQGKGGEPGLRHGLQPFSIKGVEHAHEHAAALHLGQFGVGRALHFQHQFGAQSAGGVSQFAACGLVGGVRASGNEARTALHAQAVTCCFELLSGLGRHRNAGLASRALARNSNQHGCLSSKETGAYPLLTGSFMGLRGWRGQCRREPKPAIHLMWRSHWPPQGVRLAGSNTF